ncbi:aminopeptidase N [Paraphotobacterium marinum]|uniref:Aminopeptidase N n=1 Tax=Paraphotobacterium marinum TaxID=1755811 RepID=A0A220VEG2_9GAMM|nr:aminopeptidase N [Paraphotobacterium marinum]ASK78747.1 aminopeptidase N [Paraphotobacterium marinum]
MNKEHNVKYRKDYSPSEFLVETIKLDFEIQECRTKVINESKYYLNPLNTCRSKNNSIFLDGEDLEFSVLEINNKKWNDYQLTSSGIVINNVPEQFVLKIINYINPKENTSLSGLYFSEGYFCTQCEAEGFRRITYFLDRPDVLSKFTTTIRTNSHELPFLLSNGNKIGEGIDDKGMRWCTWEDPFPKPSYLFALVAGDFDLLSDKFITKSGREITLELYVDKGKLNRSKFAMESLKKAMKWDEERFNLEYDLDIYMIVAVDFFNMGAMENKGLNVFNSKVVLADQKTATDNDYHQIERVIGHEYFHNWSGNRVTCRDWFQLSLKEGFTVFRDQEFSSDLNNRDLERIRNVRSLKAGQFLEDLSPMSHPIRPEKVMEMNNFYTRTVYDKGSEVIRMLHTLLGEDLFQKGVKLYFDLFDGQAVTCDDFVQAMERASGKDLNQFRLWYSQSGTPIVSINTEYRDSSKEFIVKLSQNTNPTNDQKTKKNLHIPLKFGLLSSKGGVIDLTNQKIDNGLIELSQSEQTVIFSNLEEKPILSILRDFSAPVYLNYDYSDCELCTLLKYDPNKFSKWNAGQLLLQKYLKKNISLRENGDNILIPNDVISAFDHLFNESDLSPAILGEIFSFPSFSEITSWYEVIDVELIHSVLNDMILIFANKFHTHFLKIYNVNQSLGQNSSEIRFLSSVALKYISLVKSDDCLALDYFKRAKNMTEKMSALTALNYSPYFMDDYASCMESFKQEWNKDGLVMDKWFFLSAKKDDANIIDKLNFIMENEESFDITNPNRVRSLIGGFIDNTSQFHKIDGSGYKFLTSMIVKIDSINPQVASRLIDPLLSFKKYKSERGVIMKACLNEILQLDSLSKDLFEKVQNALGA